MSLLYSFFVLLGLIFGSFGSVLILRVPSGRTIGGRSRCPECGADLKARHLIPLASYLIQRRRCAFCRKHIPLLYPLLELASAAIFLVSLWLASSVLAAGLLAFVLWLLLLIAVIDARTQKIPDCLSIPFVLLCIAFNVINDRMLNSGGALLFLLFFGALWLFSRGRWIGSGDLILGIGVGFLLGSLRMAIIALTATYIVGAIVALTLLLTRRILRKSRIAFVPFLAAGTFATLLLGWFSLWTL